MGFLDNLLKGAADTIKSDAVKNIRHATNDAVKNATNKVQKKINDKTEKFTFEALPTNVEELKKLPEASLDTPYKTAALVIAALCNFEADKEATFEMMDFLNGPGEINPAFKQFYTERLTGKQYKTFAFFKGATPDNGYVPTKPYVIEVVSNPYSFPEENWATLLVQSNGADNPGQIKLRKKPSTNQWFVTDILCLSDIRIPKSQDAWA